MTDYDLVCRTCNGAHIATDYHLRTLVAVIHTKETIIALAEVFSDLPDETGLDVIAAWHGQSSIRIAPFRGHAGHELAVECEGEPVDITADLARLSVVG